MYLENANEVEFPHVVSKAVFVACEMILTHEWDSSFPGQDSCFRVADFLGNPTDDVVVKKVFWDVCNMSQFGPPDIYDMKYVSITLPTDASMQMVWRKFSKIYREANGTKDAEWELCKIQLVSPSNPDSFPKVKGIHSVEFPKKFSETKRKPTFEQMKLVARGVAEILNKMRRKHKEKGALFAKAVDYHGFSKLRMPESLIGDLLAAHGLTTHDIQVEIVSVERDLTSELHHHEQSDAYVMVLGWHDAGLSNPWLAKSYRNGAWEEVREGYEIAIPAKTKHGFTVGQSENKHWGRLHFVSVQSPPIVREDGHDDYVRD